MQDWLAEQARVSPDVAALVEGSREWTYRELDQCVDWCAGWFAAKGVRSGDLVAFVSLPSFLSALMFYVGSRLGLVLVPVNSRLSLPEVERCLVLSGAAWVVMPLGCCDELSAGGAGIVELPFDFLGVLVNDYANSKNHGRRLNLDDPQAIVFTSGTSGSPKGAVITYKNHFWSAAASAYRIGTLPTDRWLCCLPLYHVGGMAILMRCCLYGTTVVLQDGFDIDTIQQAFDTQAITLISLVPTMLYRLLEANVRFPPTLRLILLGGAAATPALIERCRALNLPVAPTYGLSEACSQVATMLPQEAYRKPGSVGKPLLFTSVRIADENGHSAPPGRYGEVVVSGPTVMAGYFRDPQATATTLRDGELYTGDIGYLDADGDLWLVQRRSDLIVSGGENIYPAEIEQVLHEHPAVEAACVVGVDDPEWGQRAAAAVVLKPDTTLTEAELIAFSRRKLAGYKLPRQIRFVDALPQTASGKLQRRAVADLFQTSKKG